MEISSETTREQLAAIVVAKLREHKIDAVLVGGSLVSMYTDNKYESRDLDFVSPADHRRIAQAMAELGFISKGKDFVHTAIEFTVEFPSGPLGIGDDVPIRPEGKLTIEGVDIKVLSPTQSVMDRLINFYIYNDRQCLDQAVWIAERHPVNIDQVRAWSQRENAEDKFSIFLKRIG